MQRVARRPVISWIAAWVALFTGALLVAMLSDGEQRRRNAVPAVFVALLLMGAGYVLVFR